MSVFEIIDEEPIDKTKTLKISVVLLHASIVTSGIVLIISWCKDDKSMQVSAIMSGILIIIDAIASIAISIRSICKTGSDLDDGEYVFRCDRVMAVIMTIVVSAVISASTSIIRIFYNNWVTFISAAFAAIGVMIGFASLHVKSTHSKRIVIAIIIFMITVIISAIATYSWEVCIWIAVSVMPLIFNMMLEDLMRYEQLIMDAAGTVAQLSSLAFPDDICSSSLFIMIRISGIMLTSIATVSRVIKNTAT